MPKNTTTEEKLTAILNQAKHDAKGNYAIYHNYRRMIEELNITPAEFEKAVRKLSNILKV